MVKLKARGQVSIESWERPQVALWGETIHLKLQPARMGSVLVPRSPLTSCHRRARLEEEPGSA